jgi:hypothetical protein
MATTDDDDIEVRWRRYSRILALKSTACRGKIMP